jgi:hypothetical protein
VVLVMVALAAMSIVAVAVPSVRERTSEPCSALEKLAVRGALASPFDAAEPYRAAMRHTIANTLVRERQMEGHAGRAAATRRHGGVPAYLGCAAGYWEVLLRTDRLDPWLAAMWLPG